MRGEYCIICCDVVTPMGSPPLARGIRVGRKTAASVLGITPACAGNTVIALIHRNAYRDHPRLRGEYSIAVISDFPAPGSPPLARGIHLTAVLRVKRHGITPACAGNTCLICLWKRSARDHPRLRGEYFFAGVR